MKLSDAIALGRTLIKHNKGEFTLYDRDGTGCAGCAVGMALAAMGEKVIGDSESMLKYWPWADFKVWDAISKRYIDVVKGKQTLDQLIDWVSSIEPAELQPQPQIEPAIECIEVRNV